MCVRFVVIDLQFHLFSAFSFLVIIVQTGVCVCVSELNDD